MKFGSWIALAAPLLLVAAAPARETEPVATLKVGQEAIVTVDDGGRPVVVRLGAVGALSESDKRRGEELAAGAYKGASGNNPAFGGGDPKLPSSSVVKGEIRFRLVAYPDARNSMLLVANGYDQAVVYRAVIRRGAASQPTDVCLLLPGIKGVEQWPFPLDAIELRDIRLKPWKAGDPIPCA